jgi:hypothetical protein
VVEQASVILTWDKDNKVKGAAEIGIAVPSPRYTLMVGHLVEGSMALSIRIAKINLHVS